jgi:hypothetical protein
MGAQAVDLVVAPSGEQSHQQQKPHKKKEGFEAWKNQSVPTCLFYSKKKKRVRGQEKKKKHKIASFFHHFILVLNCLKPLPPALPSRITHSSLPKSLFALFLYKQILQTHSCSTHG